MGLFRMPSLGSDMESGTLVEWLIAPGDTVERGDVIAVVETQKGAIEVESFEGGEVSELIAQIGQTLPVGAPMARIGDIADATVEQVSPATPPVPETPPAQTTPSPPPEHAALAASPAARRAAADRGIDLATLTGTGPGGAVVLADVEATSVPAAKPSKPRLDLKEMRKAVAAAMTRSKRDIPHFYLSHRIDVQPVADWLQTRNSDVPPAERLLLGAVFVKAAAMAAKSVGTLNGHYTDDGFQPASDVNVGIAIALRGGGLVAPALAHVDTLSLAEVMEGMKDLVSRARAGRLRSSEMTRGTLTVSSLGDGGAETMAGIIFPPQVALVGIGSPVMRPWVTGDEIVPRLVTTVSLSADHRVCDGRQASRFLIAFEDSLSQMETT